MKRVPPEIDSLMWAIAEDRNDKAVTEFEARYPQHRLELLRRINMVRSLKHSKPLRGHQTATPRFQPTRQPTLTISRPAVVFVGATLLAAVAMASYMTTSLLFNSPASKPAPQKLEQRPSSPASQSQPTVVYKQPEAVPPVDNSSPTKDGQEKDSYAVENSPTDIEIKHEHLTKALEMICELANLRPEVAPGFVDQVIDLRFDQESPMNMLRDLGHRYGFTAFDQGDGTVLFIPAVDKSSGGSGIGAEPGGLSARRVG